jgi:uncharacterized FlaG/YvyC family protein
VDPPKSTTTRTNAPTIHPDSKSAPLPDAGTEKSAWQKSPEAKEIIESLQGHNQEVSIAVDPQTHKIVVKVVNTKTGELIRELPLQNLGHASDGLKELKGLFLDTME